MTTIERNSNSKVYSSNLPNDIKPNPASGESTQSGQALPEPVFHTSFVGDPMAELAVLLASISQKDREQARTTAKAEEKMIEVEGAKKVEEMHKKADDMRMDGIVSGLTQIGSGACAIGAAFSQSSSAETKPDASNAQAASSNGANPTTSQPNLQNNQNLNAQPIKKGASTYDLWKGGGEIFGGTGKFIGGFIKADEAKHDAEATAHGNAAEAAQRRYQTAHTEEQEAKDFFKKIMQFYDEMLKAKNAAMQAAIMR